MSIIGPTAEVLNNQGYSYLLRGDYPRARKTLLAAQEKDPGNPYIKNNLDLLEKSQRRGKAIE
jgi:Flp pilus assembly protein TadD